MSDEQKPSAAACIAGVVLALVGAYVGAYYAMVQKWNTIHNGIVDMYPSIYSVLGNSANVRARQFFAPMNRLDRRIRPHVWNSPEFIIDP